MKIVSACLIGCACRYDQKSSLDTNIEQIIKAGKGIPVCPEQLAGLPTPRPSAEIVGGDGHDVLDGKARVIQQDGLDVTEMFIKGAEQALHIAKTVGASEAVLKERSPSCGSGVIYDGSFSGRRLRGAGVTAALFARNGITVTSEES